MVGPDAQTIVAAVTNTKAIWNRPVRQHPRISVRLRARHASLGSAAELAVSALVNESAPPPAPFGSFNLQPEVLRAGSTSKPTASLRAKDTGCRGREWAAAVGATPVRVTLSTHSEPPIRGAVAPAVAPARGYLIGERAGPAPATSRTFPGSPISPTRRPALVKPRMGSVPPSRFALGPRDQPPGLLRRLTRPLRTSSRRAAARLYFSTSVLRPNCG
jgi:hypothetical protein